MAAPAIRPATGPNLRRTVAKSRPTAATPSSACGTRIAPGVDAEDAGRQVHDPQRRRRLVDGDEVGRVEAAEEEGLPALGARLDRGGVEAVGPARGAEAPEVEQAGRGEQAEQRRAHPRRVVRCGPRTMRCTGELVQRVRPARRARWARWRWSSSRGSQWSGVRVRTGRPRPAAGRSAGRWPRGWRRRGRRPRGCGSAPVVCACRAYSEPLVSARPSAEHRRVPAAGAWSPRANRVTPKVSRRLAAVLRIAVTSRARKFAPWAAIALTQQDEEQQVGEGADDADAARTGSAAVRDPAAWSRRRPDARSAR